MEVIKRNGNKEEVSFDKVKSRLQYLCKGLNIDPIKIAQQVVSRIYDNVKTHELDELSAEICATMSTENYEYGTLASRIIISNNHKNTSPSFSETIYILYNAKDANGESNPLVSHELYNVVMANKTKLNDVVDCERDYNFDYFGFKTLEKAYLFKTNGKIIERIQYMFLRVSLGLHLDDIRSAIESYHYMSQKYFIHATPTLFHSGTMRPQLLSCYLLGMEDSVEGIFKNITDCSLISKWAGGIGIHVSNTRSKGTHIRGTNGKANGIIPMLKVYNECVKYINQSGKRQGSIAVYLEPHHPEINEFLQLRKNHGNENDRARDLFLAVWLSDLFMEKVQSDSDWCLFDPDECPRLSETHNDEYRSLYKKYESEGRERKKVKARAIWKSIVDSQIETGTPYILFKDAANRKSNQQNLGTIRSSNLCAEILEYSDHNEYACCTLGSVALSQFVEERVFTGKFVVYGKSDCKYCNMAKMLLNNYEYEYVSLDDEEERNAFFESREIEPRKVPQVYYRATDEVEETTTERHIGGYTKLLDFTRPTYNHEKLISVINVMVKNLNKIVDLNYYPVVETERSNRNHRPLGLGVQGLADVYAKMKYPFDSPEATALNKEIFETIYYGAMCASNKLAIERETEMQELQSVMRSIKELESTISPNSSSDEQILHKRCKELQDKLRPLDKELNREKCLGSYSSFNGSPLSKGKFQFDMWDIQPSTRYDWDTLRENVMNHGVRNSLLTALMPTASTSQILSNNECFEPFTSNMYTRRTLAGDFIILNKYLMRDCCNMGIWNKELKNKILANNGSINGIDEIPTEMQDIYKTAWELKQKVIIQQAVDRGPYICQTQSMNLFFEEPDMNTLSSAMFYAWKSGLKTGAYYVRSQPKNQAQQFTLTPTKKVAVTSNEPENCDFCSA